MYLARGRAVCSREKGMVAVEEFQTPLKTHHLHARSASEARKVRSETSGEVYHLNWIRKESRPETRDQLVTRKQSQVKPTSQLSLKISPPTLTYQGVRSRMDRVWTSMDWT